MLGKIKDNKETILRQQLEQKEIMESIRIAEKKLKQNNTSIEITDEQLLNLNNRLNSIRNLRKTSPKKIKETTYKHLIMLTGFDGINKNIYSLNESVLPLYELVSEMELSKVIRGDKYKEYIDMFESIIVELNILYAKLISMHEKEDVLIKNTVNYRNTESKEDYIKFVNSLGENINSNIERIKLDKQYIAVQSEVKYLFKDKNHAKLFRYINIMAYLLMGINYYMIVIEDKYKKNIAEEQNKNNNLTVYYDFLVDYIKMLYIDLIYDIQQKFERKPKHFDKLLYCSYAVMVEYKIIRDDNGIILFLTILDDIGIDYLSLYRKNKTTGLMELRTNAK